MTDHHRFVSCILCCLCKAAKRICDKRDFRRGLGLLGRTCKKTGLISSGADPDEGALAVQGWGSGILTNQLAILSLEGGRPES